MAMTNEEDVYCVECRTRILRAGAAVCVTEDRVLKGGGVGGMDPGYSEWYDVDDRFKFDNIGFLRVPSTNVEPQAVVMPKREDEALGTMFEDEDLMVLEEILPDGPAERAGLHHLVGWRLEAVNGQPVRSCDDVREITPGLTEVTLLFRPPPPHPDGGRVLVCAGCEGSIVGFFDGKLFHVAKKLVAVGGDAKPTPVITKASPEYAHIAELIRQQQGGYARPDEPLGQ